MIILGRYGVVNDLLMGIGWITNPLRLMYNRFGVYVGMVYVMLPYTILPMLSVMQGIDRNLMKAADNLGSTPWQSFWNVFFPLSLPGVGAGLLLTFIRCSGFFVTPSLMGSTRDTMIAMSIQTQLEEVINWGFASALSVVLLVIVLILFLDFRNPLLVLLTLLPLVFGGVWTLLGMKILGMAFNPANLVIIPLLVGIGVDNGIHVIRHFLGSGSSEDEIAGSSTGRAITLSTLTTMAGFGSLIIARHQGIHSVGALLTLAMASCLVASLVVLPSLLGILPRGARTRIWRMGQPR